MRVQEFHVAGHEDHGDYVIDTHGADIPEAVQGVFAAAAEKFMTTRGTRGENP